MLQDLWNFVCKDGRPQCDFVAAISRVWYNPGYNGILGGLGTGAARLLVGREGFSRPGAVYSNLLRGYFFHQCVGALLSMALLRWGYT